ncbi:MAG TPA: hypothetical protein VKB34_18915 [Povalibacter sp.]|nr:hypothetical protein [Povalibacter sp.]
MKKPLFLLALGLAVASPAVLAATKSTTFAVRVSIVNQCSMTTAVAAITLNCSAGTPYNVVLENVGQARTGEAGTRRLFRVLPGAQGADSLFGTKTFAGVGDGSAQTLTLDGHAAASQVTATIYY